MYVVTNYGGGKNYTPSITETEKEAWDWVAELVLSNASGRGLLSQDEAEITLGVIKQINRIPEKRNMIERAFSDKIVLENGYIIGEGENENVIQVFDIPFYITS